MQLSTFFVALAVVLMSLLASAVAGAQPLTDQVGEASEIREKRDHHHHHHQGVTGPVHTFVKTDKHANFKWGVRHHVGKHYARR